MAAATATWTGRAVAARSGAAKETPPPLRFVFMDACGCCPRAWVDGKTVKTEAGAWQWLAEDTGLAMRITKCPKRDIARRKLAETIDRKNAESQAGQS